MHLASGHCQPLRLHLLEDQIVVNIIVEVQIGFSVELKLSELEHKLLNFYVVLNDLRGVVAVVNERVRGLHHELSPAHPAILDAASVQAADNASCVQVHQEQLVIKRYLHDPAKPFEARYVVDLDILHDGEAGLVGVEVYFLQDHLVYELA